LLSKFLLLAWAPEAAASNPATALTLPHPTIAAFIAAAAVAFAALYNTSSEEGALAL
jgi:hypothetical protein